MFQDIEIVYRRSPSGQLTKRVIKQCVICSSPFEVPPSDYRRYVTCRRECAKLHKRGNRNGNWKGGLSSKGRSWEADNTKLRAWREAVLTRDEGKCQVCGTAKDLEVHHVKAWSIYPDLRYDPDNGQTLCKTHHREKSRDFFAERKRLIDAGFNLPPRVPKKRVKLVCLECKSEFLRSSPRHAYCSVRCQRNRYMRAFKRRRRLLKRLLKLEIPREQAPSLAA